MHSADQNAINEATRPEDRYDTRDMKMSHILKPVGIFFVFTVICIVAIIALYNYGIPFSFPGGITRARTEAPILPGGVNPLVQTNHTATKDIVDLKGREHQELNSAGVVDARKGTYRIPIEEAMDQVANEGIKPAATEAPNAN